MNRRNFLEHGITSILTLSAVTSVLSSCSTFDEYLIEDQFDFEQDVIIVGCGLPALFAAYELKKNKIPFKLFGPDARFGSEILSMDKAEWGYFKFEKDDTLMLNLVKELNLDINWLSSQHWVVQEGSSAIVNELVDLVQGIMPKRQLRLGHKLVQIHKYGPRYQLVFQSTEREKTFYAKKVVLALEPYQLSAVKDLSLINSQTEQLVSGLELLRQLDYIRIVVDSTRLKNQLVLNATAIKVRQKNQMSRKAINNLSVQIQENLAKEVSKLSSDLICEIDVTESAGKFYITLVSDDKHPVRQLENIQLLMGRYFDGSFGSDEILDWGNIVSRAKNKTPVGFGFELNGSELVKPLPLKSFLQIVNSGLIQSKSKVSDLEQVLNLTRQSMSVYKADI